MYSRCAVVALPMFKDKIALDSGSVLANALNAEKLFKDWKNISN